MSKTRNKDFECLSPGLVNGWLLQSLEAHTGLQSLSRFSFQVILPAKRNRNYHSIH